MTAARNSLVSLKYGVCKNAYSIYKQGIEGWGEAKLLLIAYKVFMCMSEQAQMFCSYLSARWLCPIWQVLFRDDQGVFKRD